MQSNNIEIWPEPTKVVAAPMLEDITQWVIYRPDGREIIVTFDKGKIYGSTAQLTKHELYFFRKLI